MADYFVSPTGSDTNNGTIDEPLKTIAAAHDLVEPGDTIFLRGGEHKLPLDTSTVLSKSGTQDAPIRLVAYQNEVPVLNGSDWGRADYATGDGVNVLVIQTGDHWHVEGLEITGGPFLGYLADSVKGSIFKDLNVHSNDNTGFNLFGESSENMILGGEFHHNFDPQKGGQDADGIGFKFGSGEGNVIDGALVYNNSDDGIDLWNFEGSVTIKNSQFFGHGYDYFDHGDSFEGNGNGLKLSGGDASDLAELAHVVHNNVAWGNRSSGFDYNASQGNFDVYNNTAFGNGFAGFFFEGGTHVLQNNLSFQNGVNRSLAETVAQISNSWNLDAEPTEENFISLDPSDAGFLRLAPDSDLIDAGLQAGSDFNGSAPDLGAFEAENSTTTIPDEDPEDSESVVDLNEGDRHVIDVGTSADQVNQIIATADAGDQIIFQSGTHIFGDTLTIRRDDISISGQDQNTQLTFRFDANGDGRVDQAESGNGIEILGFGTGSNFVRKADRGQVTQELAEGATEITLADASQLSVGDVIHISQDNTVEYLAELGGCAPGTPCYDTALDRVFREYTTTITQIEPQTGRITLEGPLTFDMDQSETPINVVELTEIRRDISLSNLDITFEVLDPNTGQPVQPDPNLFENTQDGFAAADRPANAAIYVEGSTGLSIRDIDVTNAPSDGFTFRNSINVDAENLSVSGSYNKGVGGNGYGVNIYETFDSSFSGLDLFDLRHAVLFSAWNAESGNEVQVDATNRDINFHGGPDSNNIITVDSAVLDYGDAAEAWPIVSNGGRVVHQQTDIYGLDNVVTFANASGSSRDEVIFAENTGAILRGMGGDDVLVAGDDADQLDGGEGNDTVSYQTATQAVLIDLRGVRENERGAAGDALAGIENLVGSDLNDVLLGDDAANRIEGGAGRDKIYARNGDDQLLGGNGDDHLHGQRGDDTLTGGSGADRFYFAESAGNDQITDFEISSDLIDFSRHDGISGMDELTISSEKGDAQITFDGGQLSIAGINPLELNTEDFVFG